MPTATKNKTILTKFSSSDLQLNRDERTVGFSFSSKGNICERYYFFSDVQLPEGASAVFDEVLSHDPSHWDLSRVANKACPFLRNHTRGQKLGMVTQVSLDGQNGTSTVKLSRNNQLAEQFMSDVEDGTSGGISFGYSVEEYRVVTPAEYDTSGKLTKKALLEATKIVLFEISSEDIPADPTVGYGKSEVCFDQVLVKGDPNFNPMDRELQSELLQVKTALESAKQETTALLEKQTLLLNENNKLSEQVKTLTQAVEEKSAVISGFEKRESTVLNYYDLRQKADGLVSEGKLSSVEFNELFSENPANDIDTYLKQSDRLGYIGFHLELIQKRTTPLLNLKQSVSEPIVQPTTSNADTQARALQVVNAMSQFRPEI